MISVDEAHERIVAAFFPLSSEQIDLAHLAGRVAAEDIRANTDQPPVSVSAMDGYAVRKADGEAPRKVIGSAPAGHPFEGTVGANQTVRIFTGGAIPKGADAVVIQEEVDVVGGDVQFNASAIRPDFIRHAGIDFRAGEVLVPAGKRITARDLALLAAGDITDAKVRRRPRVAIASIGDELSAPGAPRRPGGIVASTSYGLEAMIASWGGEAHNLGILKDSIEDIATVASADADLIVTLGGASVGDHDLVQRALGTTDFKLEFWKIAMRPGKPLIFGRLGTTPLIGMPGNPVSALVCALTFLKPAIATMLGAEIHHVKSRARLKQDLPATDGRQSYIRARLIDDDGETWVSPFAQQDSAVLSVLAKADALIVRRPNAPAAEAGDRTEIIPLND